MPELHAALLALGGELDAWTSAEGRTRGAEPFTRQRPVGLTSTRVPVTDNGVI